MQRVVCSYRYKCRMGFWFSRNSGGGACCSTGGFTSGEGGEDGFEGSVEMSGSTVFLTGEEGTVGN